MRYSRMMFPLALITGLLLCSPGCGSGEETVQLAPVTGQVTQGGQPVANAIVEFFPKAGRTSVGRTDDTGAFELKYSDELGAVVGMCRVQITPGQAQPQEGGEDTVAPPMQAPAIIVKVPGTVEIQDADNVFNFELDEYRS
ncbi:MAG: hypothetical protein NXI04_15700 [Planctomycetaceae bacterium]|nr:hypothetical protein [Planctomycetaceae bacterium]